MEYNSFKAFTLRLFVARQLDLAEGADPTVLSDRVVRIVDEYVQAAIDQATKEGLSGPRLCLDPETSFMCTNLWQMDWNRQEKLELVELIGKWFCGGDSMSSEDFFTYSPIETALLYRYMDLAKAIDNRADHDQGVLFTGFAVPIARRIRFAFAS